MYIDVPAVMIQVDAIRGDLYAVVAENRHYIIMLDEVLPGADAARHNFRPGMLQLNESSVPAGLRLNKDANFSLCHPLQCSASCGRCGGVMRVIEHTLICVECGSEE